MKHLILPSRAVLMNSIISDLEHLIEGEEGLEQSLKILAALFKTASGCCSSSIPPTL